MQNLLAPINIVGAIPILIVVYFVSVVAFVKYGKKLFWHVCVFSAVTALAAECMTVFMGLGKSINYTNIATSLSIAILVVVVIYKIINAKISA